MAQKADLAPRLRRRAADEDREGGPYRLARRATLTLDATSPGVPG